MTQDPVPNVGENAVSGFWEDMPGDMPVLPETEGEVTDPSPEPEPEPEPEPDPEPEVT